MGLAKIGCNRIPHGGDKLAMNKNVILLFWAPLAKNKPVRGESWMQIPLLNFVMGVGVVWTIEISQMKISKLPCKNQNWISSYISLGLWEETCIIFWKIKSPSSLIWRNEEEHPLIITRERVNLRSLCHWTFLWTNSKIWATIVFEST